MPIRSCPECQRYWQEFANATMIQIRIANKRKLADRGYNVGLPDALEHAERAAAEASQRARQSVRDHEALHRKELVPSSRVASPGWLT
jgi:hypothetical protein